MWSANAGGRPWRVTTTWAVRSPQITNVSFSLDAPDGVPRARIRVAPFPVRTTWSRAPAGKDRSTVRLPSRGIGRDIVQKSLPGVLNRPWTTVVTGAVHG